MRQSAATELDTPAPADEIADLVRRAADGDENAWESIVRLYGRRIYAIAKSRLHDADSAEEVTQSVFATLAGSLRTGPQARYQELGKFEPWLFRIVMNRVRDEGRRRQRRNGTIHRLNDSEPVARLTTDSAIGQADSQSELRAMREAIQHLEDRDREIIELRHHGSLSFAQIAEALDEPLGTVLARHHRALKKLKAKIESVAGSPNDTEPNTTASQGPSHA